MEQFLAHEDIAIYIILIIVVLNSLLMLGWMHRQSKKTDALYEFIKKLTEKPIEK